MSEQPEKNASTFACPRTLCGALPCAFVCATIAFIAYLVLSPHAEPMRRLWLPVVVETNGNQTVLGETRQLEFWTPSVKTKDYLHKEGGEVVDKEKWQIIPSDDTVAQFGRELHSTQDVIGYRRVEEWGQGRTIFKPGWWWTMTVTTNYSVVDLTRIYQKFWKSPQAVLIEVIDNRGSNEK
jgi:hypothetical protein